VRGEDWRRNRAAPIVQIAAVAASALAIAGCNAFLRSPAVDLPFAGEGAKAATSATDDWPTFAYDYTRSGFNPNVTAITKANVSTLQLRWQRQIAGFLFSSPVVYAGNLIILTQGGKRGQLGSVVYDLSTADGHVIWQFAMGGEGQMTPTIDPAAGLVIVGNEVKQDRKTSPSYIFALSLLDGSLVWSAPVVGIVRAAPVVTGGTVYVGRAGGDEPLCIQGGLTAFNESTGEAEWNWNVDPKPDEGGSVWGAIAYDGTHLIFGTGNTCEEPIMTSNGAVSLGLNGTPGWSMVAEKDSEYDSDTGSGVTLQGGLAHFINKNGIFYAVNQETGSIVWKTALNPTTSHHHWSGGFTTAATDGRTIVEGSGLYPGTASGSGSGEFCMLGAAKPAEVFSGYYSKLQGVDLKGRILWAREMRNRLVGYVAVARGLGFVGLNQDFVALDLRTGKTLWTYAIPFNIDSSMVVVPSGVYGADDGGNVYAFALPSSARKR
jgi:outer membrane protein assembly factor BamB